uniref:F-box protein CPR1-like n=1 Tax=Erigeron canadensis TaxID=72917 RepID=UPI001CB90189|nr:F-box protein CPR1-like [Erigeron canadensis]
MAKRAAADELASTTKIFTSLALWNPLTGACYKLPPHPKGYDPHSGLIGFYSDSSNDYKLVHMVFWGAVAAYIYSQRLNSWRKIEFVIGECYFDQWSQATFCDHSLYFWVRHYEHDHEYIICFDVNTEDFRIIQFPPLPSGATRLHSSLVVIDGCIHLCVAYNIRKDYIWFKRGNMWKLMPGDSWVEVAYFPGAPDDDDDLSLDIPNVCITRNARDSWLAIMDGNNNSFEIMNMEDFTLKEHSCSSSSLVTYRRVIYEETLVSPKPHDQSVDESKV